MLAIVLLLVLAPLAMANRASASPAIERENRVPAFADSDGDGIQDDFDPDDDNDGVADDQDSKPGVPGSAPDDGPDILDPGQDSDGDGISNALDPDDNNNGTTDENDPSSFPPSNGGGSNPPEPGGNGGSSGGQQPASSGNAPSLIRSLPVTGSGADGANIPILLTLTSMICLCISMAVTFHRRRTAMPLPR
jgi:hypothetical protein